MVLALTAFAFEGNPENGGEGIKFGFFRCRAAKIAKKRQRAANRDRESGQLRYNGPVLREKGRGRADLSPLRKVFEPASNLRSFSNNAERPNGTRLANRVTRRDSGRKR